MKKIIAVCLLGIIMLAGAAQAGKYNTVNVNPDPQSSFSVWIKIIISFHRPKLDCKSGFGICLDFEVGTSKATGFGSGLCPVQARLNAKGELELMVAESDLKNYEDGFALQYFNNGSLTFIDPYTFSDAVTRQLGADRQITVKPGSYPVVHDASARTYTVTFPM